MLAREALAEAAEDALLQLQAERIGVRAAQIRRGLRIGVIAEAFGALAKDGAEIGLLHRRVGIFARARRLERIAAGLDLSLDVAGLAADTAEIFEAVVIRLELVVGDAPILDRQLRTAGSRNFLP